MNKKLISFTIKSNMGILKKPDINDGIYITFNMLHKPALLGILGAIIGLEGFKKVEKLPEYYIKLKELPIGIEPINHRNGYFQKTIINYTNTTGFANETKNIGNNLIISEQTLINPLYKIYLLLDLENEEQKKLYEYIKYNKAEYLPYFGKNEYPLFWYDFIEYNNWEYLKSTEKEIVISTIFIKNTALKKFKKTENEEFDLFDFSNSDKEEPSFAYFERLPIKYDEILFQYEYENFVFTNFKINYSESVIKSDVYKIKYNNKEIFISLF